MHDFMEKNETGFLCEVAERLGNIRKENIEMMRTERKAERTTEDCGFSGYSMFALAGGLLLCIGIIVYAFFAG